jgi:hypothetical protein
VSRNFFGLRLPVPVGGLCAALVIGAMHSAGAWSSDPNVNNPVSTAPGGQHRPQLISDGAGGTIITWMDRRNGSDDIYAQRLDSSGTALWAANGVAVCTANDDQIFPELISDGAGGAIITWQDNRSGTHNDIYAQRVNSAGAAQWTANGVAMCMTADASLPQLISDGAGGAIIVWEDDRNSNYSVTRTDIFAQRVDSSGAAQWTANGVVICMTAGASGSRLLSDGAGGAIITWADYRNNNNNSKDYVPQTDIFAQRVDFAGAVQWTANGVAICTAPYSQYSDQFISDGAGGAIITWVDYRTSSNYVSQADIFAQRMDSSGTALWTANGIGICTNVYDQYSLELTSDGAGGAIITWQDERNTPDYDIYGQRVNSAGAAQWTGDGVAICTAATSQYLGQLVADGAGGAIITFNDSRNGSTNLDIFAQRVNSSGAAQWSANGVVICTAANSQYSPLLVGDGAGGAIITWDDSRNVDTDIYAQRVDSAGNLSVASSVEDWNLY